jgi:hypothetical protein
VPRPTSRRRSRDRRAPARRRHHVAVHAPRRAGRARAGSSSPKGTPSTPCARAARRDRQRDAAVATAARTSRASRPSATRPDAPGGIEEALTHRAGAAGQGPHRQRPPVPRHEPARDRPRAPRAQRRAHARHGRACSWPPRSCASQRRLHDHERLRQPAGQRRQQAPAPRLRREPPSYQRWARRAPDAPDFKSMSVVNLAGAPDLLQVNEHGEFKYGAMTDGKETYSLLTYGRIVSVLAPGADQRRPARLRSPGRRLRQQRARLENRTVYAILTANAALSDTGALFNAPPRRRWRPREPCGLGRRDQRRHAGRGPRRDAPAKGPAERGAEPRAAYLIVPAAQEQLAYQYTSANYVPAKRATSTSSAPAAAPRSSRSSKPARREQHHGLVPRRRQRPGRHGRVLLARRRRGPGHRVRDRLRGRRHLLQVPPRLRRQGDRLPRPLQEPRRVTKSAFVVEGVVTIAKTSALAISIGDRLFWDATNSVVNKTTTAQQQVGVAVEAAANPSSTVKMLIESAVPVAT